MSGSHASGSDNYFINPKIHGLIERDGSAAVSFHRLSGNADGGTNYIVGGNFYDIPRIISASRTGNITFTNSTFSNIYKELDGFYAGFPDGTKLYKAYYINCTFRRSASVVGARVISRTRWSKNIWNITGKLGTTQIPSCWSNRPYH